MNLIVKIIYCADNERLIVLFYFGLVKVIRFILSKLYNLEVKRFQINFHFYCIDKQRVVYENFLE